MIANAADFAGSVSVILFFLWIVLLMLELVEDHDITPTFISNINFEKINPVLFFLWMCTMAVHFALVGMQ